MRFLQFKLFLLAFLSLFASGCRSYEWRSNLDVSAALSPDGSVTALIDRRETPDALSIHIIDSDGARRLLVKDVSPALAPVFSKDGSKLLFMRRGVFHQILLSVPVAGGEETELASFRVSPEHLSCEAAGGRILFRMFMEGWFGLSSSYWTYDVESGALKELEGLPSWMLPSVILSPDGRSALWTDGIAIFSKGLDGGEARELSKGVPGMRLADFLAMSSDGKLLCFRTGEIEGKNVNCPDNKFLDVDLKSIKYEFVDSRKFRMLDLGTGELRLVAAGNVSSPRFSPDSGSLLYRKGNCLCVYDVASGRSVETPSKSYEYGGFAAWFGDGRIAFQSCSGPKTGGTLWTMRPDGSGASELWGPESVSLPVAE